MFARTQELLQHLAASERTLMDAVDAVPIERRALAPANGGWSVANVLSHLARTEGQIGAFLQRLLRTALADGSLPTANDASPVVPTLPAERLLDRGERLAAPEFALPDAAHDVAAALAALQRARCRLREVLLAADGLDTRRLVRAHHVLGELTFEQWIAFAGFHQQRHAAQIRALAAAAPS